MQKNVSNIWKSGCESMVYEKSLILKESAAKNIPFFNFIEGLSTLYSWYIRLIVVYLNEAMVLSWPSCQNPAKWFRKQQPPGW